MTSSTDHTAEDALDDQQGFKQSRKVHTFRPVPTAMSNLMIFLPGQ